MKHLYFLLSFLLFAPAIDAKSYKLVSPDAKLESEIIVNDSLCFSLCADGKQIITPSTIAMSWGDGSVWGNKMRIKKAKYTTVNQTIESPFYKKANVEDHYNQLCLSTKDGYELEFRMYNDGLAYRFVATKKTPTELIDEIASYRFANNYNAWAPYVKNRAKKETDSYELQFWNDMQNLYTYLPLTEFTPGRLFFSPILVDLGDGTKLCVAESDVEDYPGMYLQAHNDKAELSAVFAPYPARVEQGGHNDLELLVKERCPYIAKVSEPRSFPWRSFIYTENDAQLVNSDMVYRLASPNRVEDYSWVKPGKVAWEWWNDWGLYGVDFKAGINTQTYKYYIDFASEHGVEYVILDEGWATKGKADLFDVIPEIDLQELVSHADSKGVGIILWAGYLAMQRDLERVVSEYSKMGVKGFKIDFLNRDDQDMIEFMYRTAKVCAEHKMLVDFHGCCKPSGIQRTYPNVLNYEAVFGLEQLKWSKPSVDMVSYDVLLPFIRMVAGPMDYTQGAMRNAAKGHYYPDRQNPMSQGTRCHQLAEYVIFDSPLNMLCDSPSNYMRELECTEYIASVPTTWDETVVLDAKVGEYVVVARRKGEKWFVSALNNWQERVLKVKLPVAQTNWMIFADGINSAKAANDYSKAEQYLESGEVDICLAPGGGWAAYSVR